MKLCRRDSSRLFITIGNIFVSRDCSFHPLVREHYASLFLRHPIQSFSRTSLIRQRCIHTSPLLSLLLRLPPEYSCPILSFVGTLKGFAVPLGDVKGIFHNVVRGTQFPLLCNGSGMLQISSCDAEVCANVTDTAAECQAMRS